MREETHERTVGDAADEGPCDVLPGRADSGLILLCDHAGKAFPPGYGTLGLAPEALERHIAYDIGAAGVTRHVSEALGAPALLYRYSRLLIDPNRGPDDPTLVMRISDGEIVPGNQHVDAGEIAQRLALYYEPYHRRIAETIDRALDDGKPPVLLSVHSFTESWKGVARPWHASILWDKDPRFAHALFQALDADPDIVAGENVPYSGQLRGDTMYRHGTCRGLAHALIEIRQDLIRDPAGQRAWGARLATILTSILDSPGAESHLHRVAFYGSHTDDQLDPGERADRPGPV